MKTIDEIIQQQQILTSSQHVIISLIQQLDKEETTLETLAHQIGNDPALSARLLKLANSSFFGMSSKVASIQSAILVLGMSTVKKLAISISLSQQAKDQKDLMHFWKDNLMIAYCAEWLAEKTGCQKEISFVAGLLHDVGTLVLFTEFPDQFVSLVHEECHGPGILAKEQSFFGFDHTELGSQLALNWHFPEPIIQAIKSHHVGEAATIGPVAGVVFCAEELVGYYTCPTAAETFSPIDQLPGDLIRFLGLDQEKMANWKNQLEVISHQVDAILME
ncbi:HDOD domain-containing protein [Leeia sp. TBRC 13508]|uniref:HDOD domain-containing protein n=1 Tax=Leeia speluncae TaxID=2884804 RepID=A0ABS8D8R1_9NEIS|nr:HDOD domain-containing protein [Leeia speluncae]MCB6184595.1 HDOD domain-containing protein [Leeia speluncae]